MNDIQLAAELLTDRYDTYIDAERYYAGSEVEVFANERWRQVFRASKLDYVLNFAKTVVDAVNDRLEIASVQSADETTAAALNKIWEQNELSLDTKEIHRKALVYGECYAIVWPEEDEDGGLTAQITYNSPTTTVMVYDEENPRKKSYAAKMWKTTNIFGKPQVNLNLYYADRLEKYSRDGELNFSTGVPNTWRAGEVVENPFGEVPVFHFRTHRPYGVPEHAAAIGPQDAINKLVANHMYTVDYQGAPQRYALSSGGNSAEAEDFDNDDTERENAGAMRSSPGTILFLQGVTQAGQFAPADHKQFTEPILAYVRNMASLTQTPLHFFQNSMFASGESMRSAETPLIKKVHDRQTSFGATWRELFKFALKIEGVEADVQINWEGAESTDESAVWTIAGLKRALGLPLKRVLMEMGYDEEIAQEIADEVEEENKKLAENGGGVGTGTAGLATGMNAHNMAVQAAAAREKAAIQNSNTIEQ